ncbi:MAG: DUF4242 domain-containing protein [Myxococcales bacterium]|nr:DUF4242 domain-containing protein [Myxococcales bacterium]
MEWIVLEREFPFPLDADMVRKMVTETTCLGLYRVTPIRSYLMPGGRRMVCIFEAPDAEAIRAVGRVNDFPPGIVWSSTLHTP